jgi:hypothetical protein
MQSVLTQEMLGWPDGTAFPKKKSLNPALKGKEGKREGNQCLFSRYCMLNVNRVPYLILTAIL